MQLGEDWYEIPSRATHKCVGGTCGRLGFTRKPQQPQHFPKQDSIVGASHQNWRRTWGKAAVKWLHKGFLSLQDMLLAFNGWGFQESAVNPRSMIFKNSWSKIARKLQIFLVSKNRLQSPNLSYLWMYTMNTKIQYQIIHVYIYIFFFLLVARMFSKSFWTLHNAVPLQSAFDFLFT